MFTKGKKNAKDQSFNEQKSEICGKYILKVIQGFHTLCIITMISVYWPKDNYHYDVTVIQCKTSCDK